MLPRLSDLMAAPCISVLLHLLLMARGCLQCKGPLPFQITLALLIVLRDKQGDACYAPKSKSARIKIAPNSAPASDLICISQKLRWGGELST